MGLCRILRDALVAVGAATLGFWPYPAPAHDDGEFAEWFRALRDPSSGISCCSPGRDCRAVEEYRASDVPGGYQVRDEGMWVDVPPSKVLQNVDNPTGRAVACFGYVDGRIYVRCLVRPAES